MLICRSLVELQNRQVLEIMAGAEHNVATKEIGQASPRLPSEITLYDAVIAIKVDQLDLHATLVSEAPHDVGQVQITVKDVRLRMH